MCQAKATVQSHQCNVLQQCTGCSSTFRKSPACTAIAPGPKLRRALAAAALLCAGRGLPPICFITAVDSCHSGGSSFLSRAAGLAAASAAAAAAAAVVAACVQRFSAQGARVPGGGLVDSAPFMLAVIPGHVIGADAS